MEEMIFPGPWVDTHCHLDALETSVDQALARAREAGVEWMVSVGTDLPSSSAAVEIAASHDQVWAAVGIHPHEASSVDEESLQSIKELAAKPRVVAIGEIGLDYFRDRSPREDQKRAFASQLAIAHELDKTVILHIRDAFPDAFEVLDEIGPPERLVFHCFSGSPQEAERALSMGAVLSFAGNVSFKNAEALRQAARMTPAEKLVVETDAPYLAPIPNRGKANEPAWVALVGKAVAEARGESVLDLARFTSANAAKVFNL